MARIVIDGQEYDDPEDMPTELRALYRDALDMLRRRSEADAGGGSEGGGADATEAKPPAPRFLFRGREYSDPREMPEEAREVFEHLGLDRPAARDTSPAPPGPPDPVRSADRTVRIEHGPAERIESRTDRVVYTSGPTRSRRPRWYDMSENGPLWPDLAVLAIAAAFFIILWLVA